MLLLMKSGRATNTRHRNGVHKYKTFFQAGLYYIGILQLVNRYTFVYLRLIHFLLFQYFIASIGITRYATTTKPLFHHPRATVFHPTLISCIKAL